MRTQVFISYSHKDKRWLAQLQVFLKPLERSGRVTRWDDTKLKAGQKWLEEIQAALESAKVAVLLVSADFLASDFIADDELPPLLEAAATEGALILGVIISPCLLPASLSQFQMVNDPNKPLVDMSKGDRDRVWVQLVKSIDEAVTLTTPPKKRQRTATGKAGRPSDAQQVSKQQSEQAAPESERAAASKNDDDGADSINVGEGLQLERVSAGDIAIAKGEDPAAMVADARSIVLAKDAKIVDSEIGDIVALKQQSKQGKDK